MRMPIVLAFCVAAALASPAQAAPSPTVAANAQPGSPAAAAADFVAAFNALDRARFDPLFADDVTLFFPSAPFDVHRVQGKEAVLKWFGRFFDAVKGRGGKLNIQPADLLVQNYGSFAIVTFHLNGGENVGRRTLVLRKDKGAWRIVHLHASSRPVKRVEPSKP